MRLFDQGARTDESVASHNERTFAFLNRSAWRSAAAVRDALETWFGRIPPDEKASMHRRFETEFDAAFFELTLHELLVQLGATVECHPRLGGSTNRPDFRATFPTGDSVLVEAVLATDQSSADASREARRSEVYDQINKVESRDFFLDVHELRDPGGAQPSGKRLRAFLERELPNYDPDEATRAYERDGLNSLPKLLFRDDDFEVLFVLIPKSAQARREPSRAIGMYPMEGGWVDTAGALRTAVNRKATRYGEPEEPFLVAVNSTSRWGLERIDMMQALYGSEAYTFPAGLEEPVMTRQPDGAWYGPRGPQNTRVSAVLFSCLVPFGLAKGEAMLFPNPWAKHPITPGLFGLPFADPGDTRVQWRSGRSVAELLGLPDGWPELTDENPAL